MARASVSEVSEMKNIFKSFLSLIMVFAILMGLSVISFAEGSSVTFKGIDEGFEFSSSNGYTPTDLFGNFKNVMPGDTLFETITVKNESADSDYIKLYVRAEVHDDTTNPLSPEVSESGETAATMADFLAQLSMKVWCKDVSDDPIYSGSPDQLDGFAESVLLGEFRKNEVTVLTVELQVPSDLDNRYLRRTGEVDWIFTAELFDDPEPPKDDTLLTVRKVWVDDGTDRPEMITINLLRDGEYYAKTELSADNQWTFTWDELDSDYTWTAEESDVPEGYTVRYKTEGSIVTIINTAKKAPVVPPEKDPVKLTVKKTWSGDEDKIKNRPDSVSATLYNGDSAVETVILGDWNNWEYTWTELSPEGDWSVVEVNIPEGYTPAYSTDGDTTTITNVAKLIQTGQMNWPIPVLCGFGFMMVLIGTAMILRRRKRS